MSKLYSAIQALLVIVIPIFLILTAVRLILNPLYLQVEYRMPNFPEDSYGFSLPDRLHWSGLALDYLLNDAGIDFLGDLRFPDGDPLYNQRELDHMVDVKVLVRKALAVWNLTAAALFALGVWAWRSKWLDQFLAGVSTGGWLAVGMVVAILVAVLTNFSALFTAFHRLFFTGDTWLFLFSDTLIRLFPMRFWQDAFILAGGFTLLAGLALGVFARRRAPR